MQENTDQNNSKYAHFLRSVQCIASREEQLSSSPNSTLIVSFSIV